jgi:membrane associated rhomboid family serine protease
MFLPIGDTPNSTRTPYINFLLIGVNISVFLFVSLPLMGAAPDLSDPLLLDYLHALGARGAVPAQSILERVSAYDLFVFRYGFRPAEPSLATLFTAMFLHAGWMHLAGNMLFLWIFGDNVEHRIGRLGYLMAYLGTGIAATFFFALFVPGSKVPLVGASGAISGVLGFYFLWFPRNRVKTFVFLFPFIMTTFMIPARLVLGFYLLLDNLLPFLFTGGRGAGVAHGAHIGGFLAGLGFAYGIDRLPGLIRRKKARQRLQKERDYIPDPIEEIGRSIHRGDVRRAATLYLGLEGREERGRLASGDVLHLGRALLGAGEFDQALTLYRRFIAERPADPDLDRAHLGAGKAMIHKPRHITSAYQYFLDALDLAHSREVAEEARMHLRAIERLGEEH